MSTVPRFKTALPGNPFGLVTDGSYAFASLNDSIAVLSDRTIPPRLVHEVDLDRPVAGIALSHSGRYLVVATAGGALVLSVTGLVRGVVVPVAFLSSSGGGAIEVATSSDDHYAFVTLEASREMAVFDLSAALAKGAEPVSPVGMVPLGQAPVGIALSPDGRTMYVTSEGPRTGAAGRDGILSVIDVRRAEVAPADSVLGSVPAGCSPVRVVVSADGNTVWVTARGSNAVFAFSAPALITDPDQAQEATVPVGRAPVGLALVDDDTLLVVADSNRFTRGQPPSDLAVVNVKEALRRKPALVAYLPVGRFPRDVASDPGINALLVANYTSDDIETIPLNGLP